MICEVIESSICFRGRVIHPGETYDFPQGAACQLLKKKKVRAAGVENASLGVSTPKRRRGHPKKNANH